MQIPSAFASPYVPAKPQPPGGMSAAFAAAPAAPTATQREFLEFAHMTPAEQMRAQILSAMGLTEEELAAMEGKEREKIEARIEEILREKVEQSAAEKGVLLDIKA